MKTGAYFMNSSSNKYLEIELNDEDQTFNLLLRTDGENQVFRNIPLSLMVNQVLENADKGELFDTNTFEWMPF